jgi:CDP-glucose 4,6-dehydratase
MHYFVTGHTGFKGSWLILLLREIGHEVSGFSLPPVEGGLFQLANLETELKHHFIGDIRDLDALRNALEVAKPDFAIHMAAQPLVLRSYEDPIETYTTNVDGTLNFLRAITDLDSPPMSLVVTTDKVYRDDGKGSYVESDPLGGHDPYSASKAMADILTQSWAATNPHLRLHVARAGNVIGAFDVSANRLLPDLISAARSEIALKVRNASSVRPWQHVLDCLGGYLLFINQPPLPGELPKALNFGPDPQSIRTVNEVVCEAKKQLPIQIEEITPEPTAPKETRMLTLDSTFARNLLGWENSIDFETAIQWTLLSISETDPRALCCSQIKEFLNTSELNL